MRAVGFDEFGGPDVLRVVDVPDPVPGPGEAVVRVHAVSVGRTLDLAARAGKLPFARLAPPHILGADHAGVVVDVAGDVDGIEIGSRVAAMPVIPCDECGACLGGHEEACPTLKFLGIHHPGAYAEFVRVPAKQLRIIDERLSYIQAASLALLAPLVYNQLAVGEVGEGTTVLVQSGGSAAGAMAVMMASQRGARVIATSRSEVKRSALEDVGVVAALDWRAPDFNDRVLDVTDGKGVDVVIDSIGSKELFARSLGALGRGGRVVISGAFVGERPTIDLQSLYTLNQRLIGVRTANRASAAGAWAEIDRGLRMVVARTFPLFTHARAAHEFVASDQGFGRVVLTVEPSDPATEIDS